MPPRRRKTTPAAAAVPATPTVRIDRGFTRREIPYRSDATVGQLLPEAVRAHGLKFAANPSLRLYTDDGPPLPLNVTAAEAGIQPDQIINLR